MGASEALFWPGSEPLAPVWLDGGQWYATLDTACVCVYLTILDS